MFSIESLRELYRWMEWADAAVWDAVLAQPATENDKKIRELLLHLHVVQRAFLAVWTNGPLTFPEPDEFPELGGIREWSRSYYAEAGRFLDSVEPAALNRPMIMPWIKDYEKRTGRQFLDPTLAETMFQVTSHSTYHRGQVNMRLRELGGEPPLVDYIAWVWFGKPEPDWGAQGAQGARGVPGA